MILSATEERLSRYKSVLNMIYFYRKELLGLNNGNKVTENIPRGTRDRLIDHGVLRKFGSKFILTDQGAELLHQVQFSPIL